MQLIIFDKTDIQCLFTDKLVDLVGEFSLILLVVGCPLG